MILNTFFREKTRTIRHLRFKITCLSIIIRRGIQCHPRQKRYGRFCREAAHVSLLQVASTVTRPFPPFDEFRPTALGSVGSMFVP